jgi:hypothetical protein
MKTASGKQFKLQILVLNFENFSLGFNWSNWDKHKSQVRYYEHNEVIYLIISASSEIPSCQTACPLSANPRPSASDTACNKMIRLSFIFKLNFSNKIPRGKYLSRRKR